MKVLNLSDLDNSDIKYKISKFPDGQQDIVIEGWNGGDDFEWGDPLLASPIQIKSRFNSFKDLELIICANNALRKLGFNPIHLYIPYLLGARSDRQFQDGGNSYLVDIIAPIINAQEFDSVIVMDVHSDVAAACIKNLKVISNVGLVQWSLDVIADKRDEFMTSKDFILVSPDAGAMKKIYPLVKSIGYTGEIVVASKYRDIISGNILSTEVPLNIIDHARKDLIIIDDICDGGRTFIEIAKIAKKRLPFNKIYLIVTHGIFSAGFEELNNYFDGIYCTNSIKDVSEIYVKQLKVI